jgi:hypothetical protein
MFEVGVIALLRSFSQSGRKIEQRNVVLSHLHREVEESLVNLLRPFLRCITAGELLLVLPSTLPTLPM